MRSAKHSDKDLDQNWRMAAKNQFGISLMVSVARAGHVRELGAMLRASGGCLQVKSRGGHASKTSSSTSIHSGVEHTLELASPHRSRSSSNSRSSNHRQAGKVQKPVLGLVLISREESYA